MESDAARSPVNSAAAGFELHAAVTQAVRLHRAFRMLECAAAGALGGAIVLAAGLVSGAEVERDLVLVSVAVALLTTILAWRERPPCVSDIVRRADRAARLDGALPAALDATRGSPSARAISGDLAAALAARVRAVVGPRQLARAARPRSPLVLAAPLLGAALVAFALETRPRSAPRDTSAVETLRGAAAAARTAGSPATGDALEIEARRLEAALVRDPTDVRPLQAARAAIEALARDLSVVDPARASLERVVAELGGGDSGPAARSGEREAGASVAGGQAAPEAGFAGSAGPAPGSPVPAALANGSPDGRMFGPPAGGEPSPGSGLPANGTAGPGGPGRGATSARWWPSRYDAVVARYLAR